VAGEAERTSVEIVIGLASEHKKQSFAQVAADLFGLKGAANVYRIQKCEEK